MRHVLDEALRLSRKMVVISLHSFSLLKIRDLQYRDIRPDLLVLRRMQSLCEFLRKRSDDFRVVTFSDHPRLVAEPNQSLPDMGTVVPVLRKVIQGVNRFYWI
jgi:hypothetical protein